MAVRSSNTRRGRLADREAARGPRPIWTLPVERRGERLEGNFYLNMDFLGEFKKEQLWEAA